MASPEERIIEALSAHGARTPAQLVALGVMRTEGAVLKAASASEGRILNEHGRLHLPGQLQEPQITLDPAERLSDYVIFDLEATSADADTALILELAAVRVRGGAETAHFERLVSGVAIPREVAQLTGLSAELLGERGVCLTDALRDFLEWLGSDVLLAHNGQGYDLPVLRRALESTGLELGSRPVLDSLLLAPLAFARDAEPPEVYKLETLHALVAGQVHASAHRALDDCRATLRVVTACVQRLLDMPAADRTLLALLPVPEFALAWQRPTIAAGALATLTTAALRVNAERAHVFAAGQKTPQTWQDMLPTPRPGQERMLDAVAQTLREAGVSVIEAPTGTGKTRGYLLPALLQGQAKSPIIVSTYTRQLQNQVLAEAQALRDSGFNLSVLALKGQSNYLCPDRLAGWLRGKHDPETGRLYMPPGEARAAALLLLHARVGEFDHLPPTPLRFSPDFRRLRQTVATVRARCSEGCEFHQHCAYFPMFQARESAQVIVINHALLFQTLIQGKDELAGVPITRVVVDEAHDLSDAAQQALRREAGVQGLRGLLGELLEQRPRRLGAAAGPLGRELLALLGPYAESVPGGRTLMGDLRSRLSDLPDAPDKVLGRAQEWLSRQTGVPENVTRAFSAWKRRVVSEQGFLSGAEAQAAEHQAYDVLGRIRQLAPRLQDLRDDLEQWQRALRTFAMQYGQGGGGFGYTAAVTPALADSAEFRAVREGGRKVLPRIALLAGFLRELGQLPALKGEVEILAGRLDAAHEALKGLLGRDPGQDVYAVSASDDDGSLWSVPLWLHERLAPLWAGLKSVVFTSATLRIPGSEPGVGTGETADFGLFQTELGLPKAQFVTLPPTLPYELGQVMLASHLPLTRQPTYPAMAGQELSYLAPQLPHRSLHILTSNERQRGVSGVLRDAGIAHLSSVNDGPDRVVRELGQRATGMALGSAGFMQGVDIRHLSMVSLDRVPFPIPDVVLSQQRVALGDFEKFWNTIYLPRAVLKFVQAFGRLIRDGREGSGPGAFVLWDKRLPVSHYQSRFLGALPVPPQNIHRLHSREELYAALSALYGAPLAMPPLVSAKGRLLAELRGELATLPREAWPALLERGLQEAFEIPRAALRPGQLSGMTAALDGRDVLTVLPTGSGKSVIFQLPALLAPGYTLVISPLVALMQDQVLRLQQLGLPAAGLWGGLSRGEQLAQIRDTQRGDVKLLYVAPERVQRSRDLQELMRQRPPARVVYDEAHCLTEWGHDFRPDYLKVHESLRGLGLRPPVSAFTATATPAVQRQLTELLEMDRPLHETQPVARPNLHYRVIATTKGQRDQVLVDLIMGLRRTPEGREGRVIVYAGSRDATERVAALLGEIGVQAAAYHAGLSPAIRAELVELFQDRAMPVIVATNAFGMGVDAPDIRLVVHYDAPLSLEAYVQEAGRAGRDGAPAYAMLLKSGNIRRRATNMIGKSYPGGKEVEALLSRISAATYPTERELADEDVDISRLSTVLHLLQEAGVVQADFVPGPYRVFALYGVEPPADPQVAQLLAAEGAVHLTREFGKEGAAALQDRLHAYAQEGRLGVSPLAPALDVRIVRWNLAAYEEKCKALRKQKLARFEDFEHFLTGQTCREYKLHAYFDAERQPYHRCGRCDACEPGLSLPWSGQPSQNLSDIWNPERELLRMMHYFQHQSAGAGKARGRGTLIRLLQGEDGQMRAGTFKTYSNFEKSAPGYRLLRFVDDKKIEETIDHLTHQGKVAAVTEGGFPVLGLTEAGLKEAQKWTRP
ncbi:RecQ family ATP-dependent DNA helicase [Deinococcus marmoris]|uniref:RecQ family ATP-dependent DNA helicase n=1 Tax=Deinococcus marmoris TaxID=249408 RepID=UPI00068CF422|nr:RecQ family ATP-dependent DNA helicase [Deinococcus marmoris]